MNTLRCAQCQATYPLDDVRWKCDCGGILDIEFEPVFDLDKIEARRPTMWRYREAIPIRNDDSIIAVMVMEELPDDQRRPTHILNRGDYQSPGAQVHPGTPAALPALPKDAPGNRLSLARWLTSRLTIRAMMMATKS